MSISRVSLSSLFVVPKFNDIELSSATAFLVERNEKLYLITNWHVVSGRNPKTGQALDKNGAIPNRLNVQYITHMQDDHIQWAGNDEKLIDQDGNPLWLEHPTYGRQVDVVAIEIERQSNYTYFPYALDLGEMKMYITVANSLSIVGFPFGISAGGLFGVWLKGWIASEPDIDYSNLPRFLIDARTRHGQSGSPVVSYSSGGGVVIEGKGTVFTGEVINLQGIYSGRINEESDIGIVWKRRVIAEIIDGGIFGNNDFQSA